MNNTVLVNKYLKENSNNLELTTWWHSEDYKKKAEAGFNQIPDTEKKDKQSSQDIFLITRKKKVSKGLITVTCPLKTCNSTYSSVNDLAWHIKLMHSYTCTVPFCKFSTLCLKDLVGHYEKHSQYT
jgi:hypothetical protein